MENSAVETEIEIGADTAVAATGKTWKVGTLTYTSAGIGVLFFWLLWGDFAWSMKERSVYSVAQLMLKSFGSSDLLLGILMGSLPNGIGMILGPIISYRSDRHRGRWGRRVPYLFLTTLIAAPAMLGLAATPWLGGMLQRHFFPNADLSTCVLIFFGVFWVTFEIGTVAANAIFVALINDVVPREFLGRFFGLFRALSLLAGIVFNYWLLERAGHHYIWLFVGMAALYGIGFLMMCLKVREGEYPPPVDPPHGHGFTDAVKLYFRECFANSYYRWVIGAYTLGFMAGIPVNTFSLFYAQSLKLSMADYGASLAITFLVSFCLAYFLGMLADRFHPLRMGIVMIGAYAVTMAVGGALVVGPSSFVVVFVVHGVITGAFYTVTASYGQRLFPQARFAQFNSAMALMTALGGMILPPLIGRYLDVCGHVYRYTFFMGAVIAGMATIASLILYRRFVALGGTKAYEAPE